jgi:hypothetical protein
VLALWQAATGVEAKESTPLDNEVLYWAKQAYSLQAGKVKPTNSSDGFTGLVTASGLEAAAAYRLGKTADAIALLKGEVAKALKKSVAQVEALAAPHIAGVYTKGTGPDVSPNGYGKRRFLRLGYNREDIRTIFHSDVCVMHNTMKSSSLTFLQTALSKNGALLSKASMAYAGMPYVDASQSAEIGGMSVSADVSVNGSAGLFCCIRSAQKVAPGYAAFDPALLLRTDVYIIQPDGDGFGDMSLPRALEIETIAKVTARGLSTSSISAGSPNQVWVQGDIDLREYLYYYGCGSESVRQQAIALCKMYGFTSFANGRKPEDVFVSDSTTGGIK